MLYYTVPYYAVLDYALHAADFDLGGRGHLGDRVFKVTQFLARKMHLAHIRCFSSRQNNVYFMHPGIWVTVFKVTQCLRFRVFVLCLLVSSPLEHIFVGTSND